MINNNRTSCRWLAEVRTAHSGEAATRAGSWGISRGSAQAEDAEVRPEAVTKATWVDEEDITAHEMMDRANRVAKGVPRAEVEEGEAVPGREAKGAARVPRERKPHRRDRLFRGNRYVPSYRS